MAQLGCRLHPHSRLRRDGYYGKHKEFVRWVCVPGDGLTKPHYLRQDQMTTLRVKALGGRQATCEECERVWAPTEGLANAAYDNFVLREKAKALVAISLGGLSLRGAAHEVRVAQVERRTGRRPAPRTVSRDGRMARDWVPQYTQIIASELLPKRWPHTITVDSFDVRIPSFDARGNPLKKGHHLYSVFAAVGYEKGQRRGLLWHIAAFPGESEAHFREFFRQLEGQPEVVVCDGAWAIRNAAAWAFPKARVVPCAWHLYNRLKAHVQRAGLYNRRRRLFKTLLPDMFLYPARYDHFDRVFRRYRKADSSKAPLAVQKGIADTFKWQQRNRLVIRDLFRSNHWPRDLTHLEEHLDEIQRRLGDRARAFRNLHRLNCVLTLMLVQLRGQASAASWTRLLRENHVAHGGKAPPRRLHDGELLRF